MSATRSERESTRLNREDHDRRATAAGHSLMWSLGENASRKGYGYFAVGECTQCAAVVVVGPDYSTSHGPRDARHVACSGPGTAVLTEIEAGRLNELVTDAVAEFGRAVKDALGSPAGAGRWVIVATRYASSLDPRGHQTGQQVSNPPHGEPHAVGASAEL